MARCDVGICSQPLKLAFTGSIPSAITDGKGLYSFVDRE
jgi:hypothetical protein